MSHVDVSIVIPAFNCEESIAATIDSALLQAGLCIEVVVVNDCSVDGTLDVLLSYGDRIVLVDLKENVGGAEARNIGVEHSFGEYISFLDSDDVFFQNKVVRQISEMHKNNADFSYCQAVDEIGNIIGAKYTDVFWVDLLIGECDIVSSSGIVVSRTLFDRISGFDVDFKRQQDIEFSIRCSFCDGIGICFLEEALYRKINSGSPSFQKVYQGVDALFDKFKPELTSLPKNKLNKIKAKYFIRFSELLFVEKKIIFVVYLFRSLFLNPWAFYNRIYRYYRKVLISSGLKK
tara:strand:- start:11905 stop:12774 length:870 start_codon:yes stop_codon:yes gene_type:complete